MSCSADYEVWSGRLGTAAYIHLLTVAGLLWLGDGEKIVAWWIEVGDGGRLESQAPVVRRVRYTPPRGWKGESIKVWDHRTAPGQPGKHIRNIERIEGDAWPPHWPAPRLPLQSNRVDEASDG